MSSISVGSVVRFERPLTPAEVDERYLVRELRGDRALVQLLASDFTIVPTFTYLLSDLVECGHVSDVAASAQANGSITTPTP